MSPYWFDTSPKATYYTPVVNGFQAGVSYTPSSKHRTDYSTHLNMGPSGATPENDGDWKDVIGLGSQWNGDFGGTSVGFSAVGGLSSDGMDEGEATDTVATRQGLGFYELIGKVGFGGFTIYGSYWDFGDGEAPADANQDWSGWGLGTSYTFGPYGLEVGYVQAEQSRTFAGGAASSSDFDGMALSLGYMIAPGLAWYGDVVRGAWDIAGTGEPMGDGEYSATVFLSGFSLNF